MPASIGLLASMHSVSSSNSGIGLSLRWIPASVAYVMPAASRSRETRSSFDMTCAYPVTQIGNPPYFGGSPLA